MRTLQSSLPLVTLLLAPLWQSSAQAQQQNVLDVGTRSQLFIDQNAVHEARGIAFTPHAARKHPGNPLVISDRPWEGWYVTTFCGTVLFNEEQKQFQMWYETADNPEYFKHGGICYAVSADGLRWKKPTVGTVEALNGKPHNMVSPYLCPSVFFDAAESEPSRRYKMICFDVNRGYLAMLSPDGLRWTEQSPKAILPISYVDDVITAFRDRRTGQFIALPKMITPVFGRLRRSIYSSASQDFKNWSKIEPALFADRRDDLGSLARIERARPVLNYPDNMNVMRTEFYGSGAYSAESCVVGFPWVFTINANVPQGNQEGPIEVQLAVTRDLERWDRPFRTPVIPPGQPDEWDSGMILTASQAIDVGDEVWMYYGGSNYTHGAPVSYVDKGNERGKKYGGSIGLATWKRDRFVSADAPAEGGTLTTVPLRFAGKRLEINARAHKGGEVRVELLDAGGRPLAGGLSEPFAGDDLRHTVVFPGQTNLDFAGDRPVCLRFHLRNAELYAFAFRDAP